MLSLGKIYAGPSAARYYTDQLAKGREDYYAGEGEAPGWWTGRAADGVGLTGEVEPTTFAELLGGGGLGRPITEGQVAGWDMTFRAPKSVSVLWGVADAETAAQLRDAHGAAVHEALGYLEDEACWARRGNGGQITIAAGGFVAAAFRHRASREGDPLLHTHVVAVNRVQGADGRWTAPDARHLHRHAKTAGYLYQAVLRAEVTERLGLRWGEVKSGVADLASVPRPVIEHFSRRRRAILDRMADHGGRSAAAAQVAALDTRRAKQEVNADQLREQWRSRAAEHGLDAPTVAQAVEGRPHWPRPAAIDVEALTATDSTFGRSDVIRALAEAHPEGARVTDLTHAADALCEHTDVVPLAPGVAPGGVTEPRYTTRDLLAVERVLLDGADHGRNAGRGRTDPEDLRTAIADRGLSVQQEQVVTDLCTRGDAIAVVRAAAGTGKTYALDAARDAWQASGHHVEGTALSARAARELQDQAAIPSGTIAQLRARLGAGEHLPHGSVLVVDEAGMVGTRDLARLAEATAAADAKLVLVGDDRQLPEIRAGGAFHALAERTPSSHLTEVRRQRHAWDRQALDQLRSGEVERWASIYREKGRITVAETARVTRQALVNDWSRADGDALMIAARREDVRDLNDLARQVLQADGRLGPDELVEGGRAFAAGDRIIGTRNDRTAGILNGQRGEIETIDDAGRLSVWLDGRPQIAVVEPDRVDHGYAITAHRAQGATVDRAFVLGGEELYREWGYTALSRHREEARFYIAHGDLDRDLPPEPDYLERRIAELMTRERTKALALESLPEADRSALEAERDQLREELATTIPSRPRSGTAQLDAAAAELDCARLQAERLREERDALGWPRRKQRDALDTALERTGQRQAHAAEHLDALTIDRRSALAAERVWAEAHPEAIRLLAIDAELRARDVLDRRADRHLEALGYQPPAPDHLDLDDALDLGR